jgi:hypothetical protein
VSQASPAKGVTASQQRPGAGALERNALPGGAGPAQFTLARAKTVARPAGLPSAGSFLSSAALPKHDHREEQHRDAGHDDDDDLPLHFSALRQFGQLRVMHAAAGRRELAAPMFGDRPRWRVWEPRWRRRGFFPSGRIRRL